MHANVGTRGHTQAQKSGNKNKSRTHGRKEARTTALMLRALRANKRVLFASDRVMPTRHRALLVGTATN
eukprot:11215410-Lingulodinium_polyedra.AAC.1